MDAIVTSPQPGEHVPDRDREWMIDGAKVVGLGSFHKTLPQNDYGEALTQQFEDFKAIIINPNGDFEAVARGTFTSLAGHLAAPLVSPQTGLATEGLGPDPTTLSMLPAPKVDSISTAAEMTELYWMALHRDHSFDVLQARADLHDPAVGEIKELFAKAVIDGNDPGHLTIPTDMGGTGSTPDIRPATLYRSGLQHEDLGPLVSQFFLHDAQYGTQTIVQKQFPYVADLNYLTTYHDWIRAQTIGRDYNGDPYPEANDPADPNGALEGGDVSPTFRRVATMRDLARFVHKDALHQAYFNAALLLLAWDADLDPGNPYSRHHLPMPRSRQAGFGTLGGPHLLTLVSEVASRALKVVWRQKWQIHLRLRPEVYGGRMQMQRAGHHGVTRPYGLPEVVFHSKAAEAVHDRYGTWFLPMAFTSGSPVHPAYGAGHATVAGACVTILKAWFKEDETIESLLSKGKARHPLTRQPVRIVQPSVMEVYRDAFGDPVSDGTGGFELPDYAGCDKSQMTVGGELNKLASNVAMGRSMGGVHWRSDNTRSLRLGEQVAKVILCKMVKELKEPLSLSFTSFDGMPVTIDKTCDFDMPGMC